MKADSRVGESNVTQLAAPPRELAGDELDLSGIGSALARRKKLIAGATLLGFLGALSFVLVVKPSYTGDARVIIENQETYFTQPDKTGGPIAAPDSETVTSQEQLITSRDLGREVIRALGLKGNPEFDPLASGQGMMSRVMMMVGLKASMTQLALEDRILENYSKNLTVFALPKSRVVSIQFSARDPKLAAKGANTIADLYIGIQQKAKQDRARVAAVSLGNLITDLRSKLAAAETKVESFRSQTGLMMGANNALVPSQQLAEINTQLASARNLMAEAQAKARLIRDNVQRGRLGEISDIAKDEVVRRIAIQRSSLRSQMASEARTLGPAHPRMKELNAQLASVETELRNAGLKTARGLENDAKIAGARVENLQAAIENQQQKVGATSVDQVKLRELELEAKLIRGQFESNLNKYREALARQHAISTPGDARIISRAFEPQRPSFPKKVPVLIFATLAALVLALGYVVSAELLSGRAFVTSQRLPDYAPATAADPMPASFRGEAVPAEPVQSASEPGLSTADQRLLKKLSALDTHGYGRRILVCPESKMADHAAGIETVARKLSEVRRVILVDLSGRIETSVAGLAELLEGVSSFGEVIERDNGSRLHVIARGWSKPEIGPALDNILDALSQTYEFIMIVAPEDDEGAMALDLSPAIDLAIIAAAAAASGERAVSLRRQLLEQGAAEVAIWASPRNDARSSTFASAGKSAA